MSGHVTFHDTFSTRYVLLIMNSWQNIIIYIIIRTDDDRLLCVTLGKGSSTGNQRVVANNQRVVANNQRVVANNQRVVANNQLNGLAIKGGGGGVSS